MSSQNPRVPAFISEILKCAGSEDPSKLPIEWLKEQAGILLRNRPTLLGPVREPYQSIWNATCRIIAPGSCGSGFFVESTGLGAVVTCAHVVEDTSEVTVERYVGAALVYSMPARLIAIDLARDLALLEASSSIEPGADPNSVPPVVALGLGVSPAPGTRVVFCGFPFGVETPRLAEGLISGVESVRVGGAVITALALDANINSGNSGGPICDEEGHVVGIVFARPPIVLEEFGFSPEVLSWFQRLNANNGIGFALDPADIQPMIHAHNEVAAATGRTFTEVPPTAVSLDRQAFVQLQMECHNRGRSPFGPFSFSKTDFQLHSGWLTDADRVPLEAPGWERNLLKAISWSGGSFWIRGWDIVLYRQRYGGYIVPVTIQLQ